MKTTHLIDATLVLAEREGRVNEPRKAAPVAVGCEFSLPIPPSTNHLFANVRGRGRVPTKAYTAWRKAASAMIRGGAARPCRMPCRITVIITGGKGFSVRRDLDNLLKPVLDFCANEGLIADDNVNNVLGVRAEYVPGKAGKSARCEVVIESV